MQIKSKFKVSYMVYFMETMLWLKRNDSYIFSIKRGLTFSSTLFMAIDDDIEI